MAVLVARDGRSMGGRTVPFNQVENSSGPD